MAVSTFEEWLQQVKASNKRAQNAIAGLAIFIGIFVFTLLSMYGQRDALGETADQDGQSIRYADRQLRLIYESPEFSSQNTSINFAKWIAALRAIRDDQSDAGEVYPYLVSLQSEVKTLIGLKEGDYPDYETLNDSNRDHLLRVVELDYDFIYGPLSKNVSNVLTYLRTAPIISATSEEQVDNRRDPRKAAVKQPLVKQPSLKQLPEWSGFFAAIGCKKSLSDLKALGLAQSRNSSGGSGFQDSSWYVQQVTGQRGKKSQTAESGGGAAMSELNAYQNLKTRYQTTSNKIDELGEATIKVPVVDLNVPISMASYIAIVANISFLIYLLMICSRFVLCVANGYAVGDPDERERLLAAASDFPLIGRKTREGDFLYALWLAMPCVVGGASHVWSTYVHDGSFLANSEKMTIIWYLSSFLLIFAFSMFIKLKAQSCGVARGVPCRFVSLAACRSIQREPDTLLNRIVPHVLVVDHDKWQQAGCKGCECDPTCKADADKGTLAVAEAAP